MDGTNFTLHEMIFIEIELLDDAYDLLNEMKVHYDGRAYHNVFHVRSMLKDLGEWNAGEISHDDWRILCYATLFHDFVYDPHQSNNEELSAIAWEVYAKGRMSSDFVQKVTELIRLTADYTNGAKAKHFKNSILAKKLAILDLGVIIHGGQEELQNFEKAIRSEYAWVPWCTYKEKRREVLAKLAIFLEDVLGYDTRSQAYKNCQWLISHLENS